MYLIDPPTSALHKPVDPSKIVFAGDSAGAALCLTTLTILRDMGLPLPAGAVLISPWVDLTHSFPSVMANSETVSASLCRDTVVRLSISGHYTRIRVSGQALDAMAG